MTSSRRKIARTPKSSYKELDKRRARQELVEEEPAQKKDEEEARWERADAEQMHAVMSMRKKGIDRRGPLGDG